MPEKLTGLIERVTFHNPENGFAVLKVQVKGHQDLVTVLGNTTSVSAGEHLEADPAAGCWPDHQPTVVNGPAHATARWRVSRRFAWATYLASISMPTNLSHRLSTLRSFRSRCRNTAQGVSVQSLPGGREDQLGEVLAQRDRFQASGGRSLAVRPWRPWAEEETRCPTLVFVSLDDIQNGTCRVGGSGRFRRLNRPSGVSTGKTWKPRFAGPRVKAASSSRTTLAGQRPLGIGMVLCPDRAHWLRSSLPLAVLAYGA